MDGSVEFAEQPKAVNRKDYMRDYMKEYRQKKNYEVNRWRVIHFCKANKYMPNSQSIKKYNITKEELEDIFKTLIESKST